MNKHTLGPWHLAGDADGTMVTDDKGAQIAMWPPQGGTVEQCANARLIAVAPDLLTALLAIAKEAGDQFGHDESPGTINRMAFHARQAIRKATGDQS